MAAVLTLEKSLLVLEAIVRHPEGIGTRPLAQLLGMSVASVHNIATTYSRTGYVRQDETTRLFHAGIRLMLLSRHPSYLRSLTSTARSVVHEIAAELNESVMLVTTDHGRLINLEYVPSTQALRVQEPEDMGGVAHGTAFGKLLLAHFSKADLDTYLRQYGLPRHTPKTITHEAALRRELVTIREQGFSETHDELCEGISALAVPIRDPWGTVFASLGASAPTVRLNEPAQIKLTLDGLRRAAAEIEKRWAASAPPSTGDTPPGNRRGRPRKKIKN
ncbi:IclR family transcriptional regulator [Opitutaceae bacterium TAV4]|nr:IclR family transcriptional regulator [Opitutaceae bacterium TAV4]RRK02324.1 IclR family transcriptional regulator [Opitutaceae bacterium TAV3]